MISVHVHVLDPIHLILLLIPPLWRWAAAEGAVAQGCVRLLRDCGCDVGTADGAGFNCVDAVDRVGCEIWWNV